MICLAFFFSPKITQLLSKVRVSRGRGPLRKLQESRPLGDSGWDQDGSGRLGICQLRRTQRDFLMRSGSPGRNGGREAVMQKAS